MVHKFIYSRRSPVLFADKPIDDSILESLFEAARWAPSSNNQQPWRFIVAKKENEDDYNRLFDCLARGNQLWAKNVPLLILSIAETISSYNQKLNKYAFHDVGLAVSNLIFQATSSGLFVHQMGGYDNKKARDVLKIPSGYEPVAMIAVGYLADSDKNFPDELKTRERKQRTRKPLSQTIFNGLWGNQLYNSKS